MVAMIVAPSLSEVFPYDRSVLPFRQYELLLERFEVREDFDARVSGIATLGEPVRRALYRFVVAQPSPVSRDQAAEGLGMARHVAKFHLDKLVEDGLLDVEYRRPPGRGGPGAGRPAKLYRRSSREVEVSLPDRRYDLAGRLLARAVSDATAEGIPVAEALRRAASDQGRALGREARTGVGSRPSRKALTAAACGMLDELGYEPRPGAGGIGLVNCPFHTLASEYTDLVCTMNRELLGGLLEGLEHRGLDAHLDPAPGMCCVRLRPKEPPRPGRRPAAGA
jgi:predicted ArsR family transcriptional regulator